MDQKVYTLDELRFVAECIENSNSENTEIDKDNLVQRLKKTMGHAYALMGK